MDKKFKPTFYGTVTVGARGQVTLPKEGRKELGIKPGDKLIAVSAPHGEGMALLQADSVMKFMEDIVNFKSSIEKKLNKKYEK